MHKNNKAQLTRQGEWLREREGEREMVEWADWAGSIDGAAV